MSSAACRAATSCCLPSPAYGGRKRSSQAVEQRYLTQIRATQIVLAQIVGVIDPSPWPQEPTKMLRGALAFFRGASCSVKSRDPIKSLTR